MLIMTIKVIGVCIMIISCVVCEDCEYHNNKDYVYNVKPNKNIIYHSIGDKARGMGDWNDGKEPYDYCDGLSGSSDC